MNLPRLIPRLIYGSLTLVFGLICLSLILFSSGFLGAMDRHAEAFLDCFARHAESVWRYSERFETDGVSGKNKAFPISRLIGILRDIKHDNLFIPDGALVLIRLNKEKGDVAVRFVRNGLQIANSNAFVAAAGFKGDFRRRFVRTGEGIFALYTRPLNSGRKTCGQILLASPLTNLEIWSYFSPFIILCLVYIAAFMLVLLWWIGKIRQNIDLLYLSLEKEPAEFSADPPSHTFQEFWQVAQWNMAVATQIQESVQLQSTLFNVSPCGILIVDPEGKILEINTRAWEIAQRVKDSKKVVSICDLHPEFHRIMKNVLEGKTDSGEIALCGTKGEIDLIYAVSPVQTATWKGAVMFWLDQTEVKQLGSHLRQTERYQLVGELASMAAHELRNPLTTIIANAQLGQIIQDEAKQKELFVRIQQASARMNDFLKEMLGLCRPGEAQLSPMSIYPILAEVLGLVRAQLLTQGIELELKVEDGMPRIWGEEKLLRQVFLNLIQNAIQAMPSGGKLALKAKTSGNEVIVTIRDTGNGIPPEIQGRIFESFITSKKNGTGLGLFITRQIMVQNFGGRIWFSTSPGEGTEFYLAFPLAEPLAQTTIDKTPKLYWTGKQSVVQ